MPGNLFRTNEDDPLDTRIGRLIEACRRWLSSEIGGWTVIGTLACASVTGLLGVHFKQELMQLPMVSMLTPQDQRPLPAPIDDLTVAPDEIRSLEPDAARAFNARTPIATLPNPAARPFILPTADIASYRRAVDCMTAAVYYEAAQESDAGQAAVAQVILNRSRHPAYPHTICGVVFQGSERSTGCQFSFTCDGSLSRQPSQTGWQRARTVAVASLGGAVFRPVGMATHYHADYVAPYWAPRLTKLAQIGAHIFYRWPAYWGEPPAFRAGYGGIEPVVAKMAAFSSAEAITLDPTTEDARGELPVLINVPSTALPVSTPTPRPVVPDVQIASTSASSPASAPAASAPPPAPRQQATTALSDPLANPADTRQPRRRQRLPAPSGW